MKTTRDVVLCKDCRYHPIIPENWNGDMFKIEWPVGEDLFNRCPCNCEDYYYSWIPKPDWFCGNGKKKGG